MTAGGALALSSELVYANSDEEPLVHRPSNLNAPESNFQLTVNTQLTNLKTIPMDAGTQPRGYIHGSLAIRIK